MSINAGYDFMVEFIRAIFPEVANQIEAYEIVGSYYDNTATGRQIP